MMINLSKPTITKDELKAVLSTLITDRIEEATISNQLENELAKFLKSSGAVLANSVTAAIHLLFLHLKLGPGDKVVLPALLPVAFYDAVQYCGCEAVLYDCVRDFNEDKEKVVKLIDENTKLVIVSPVFGFYHQTPDFSGLNVPVLEYGWGSLGTTIEEELIGSFGDYAIFSLNNDSIINTAYGGVIFVKEKKQLSNIKSFKNYNHRDGQKVKYDYRVSDLLSAMALIQLQNLKEYIEARKRIFEIYHAQFHQLEFELPDIPPYVDYNYWLYPVRIPGNVVTLREKLRRKGIGVSYLLHNPLYSYFNLQVENFPETDRFFRKHLLFPIYPSLKRTEVEKITKTVAGVVF
jgi:dTDP-4-amino-4,6-dideoxygalactose transaminase